MEISMAAHSNDGFMKTLWFDDTGSHRFIYLNTQYWKCVTGDKIRHLVIKRLLHFPVCKLLWENK